MSDSPYNCPCDSGLRKQPRYDARGIFLCYTCDKCHSRKMKGYRAEVLTDPKYEADEDIEPEEFNTPGHSQDDGYDDYS